MDPKHERAGEEELEHGRHGLVDALQDDALGVRHIIRHAHEDIAGALSVEPFQRQMLDLAVELAPQVIGHLQLEGVVRDGAEAEEDLAEKHGPQRHRSGGQDAAHILRWDDVIQKPLRKTGKDEAKKRARDGHEQSRQDPPRIAGHESKEQAGRRGHAGSWRKVALRQSFVAQTLLSVHVTNDASRSSAPRCGPIPS